MSALGIQRSMFDFKLESAKRYSVDFSQDAFWKSINHFRERHLSEVVGHAILAKANPPRLRVYAKVVDAVKARLGPMI
jgi:hypothetical protein